MSSANGSGGGGGDGEGRAPSRKKKTRRKRNHQSVCVNLTHCRYEVVQNCAEELGWQVYKAMDGGRIDEELEPRDPKTATWNLYWMDTSVSPERVMRLLNYQKINHFPGMYQICRKGDLARSLQRMERIFPDEYRYYPQTWVLPTDTADLRAFLQESSKKRRTVIVKPVSGCQGKGIFLTRSPDDITDLKGQYVAQQYVKSPLLIDKLKFDLRVYALVTCCDPLRILLFREGLVRCCTVPYKEPTGNNMENDCMHLTNYAINKVNDNFVQNQDNAEGDDGESGAESASKRSFAWLRNWLAEQGFNADELWTRIAHVIVKTIISIQPWLAHTYRSCQVDGQDKNPFRCFEVLGFDILVDTKLRPWLIEVNHSPSFSMDSPLDRRIKHDLILTTMRLQNVQATDRAKYARQMQAESQSRLYGTSRARTNGGNARNVAKTRDAVAQLKAAWKKYLANEARHRGDFDLVFPPGVYENQPTERFLRVYQALIQGTADNFRRIGTSLNRTALGTTAQSHFANTVRDAFQDDASTDSIIYARPRDNSSTSATSTTTTSAAASTAADAPEGHTYGLAVTSQHGGSAGPGRTTVEDDRDEGSSNHPHSSESQAQQALADLLSRSWPDNVSGASSGPAPSPLDGGRRGHKRHGKHAKAQRQGHSSSPIASGPGGYEREVLMAAGAGDKASNARFRLDDEQDSVETPPPGATAGGRPSRAGNGRSKGTTCMDGGSNTLSAVYFYDEDEEEQYRLRISGSNCTEDSLSPSARGGHRGRAKIPGPGTHGSEHASSSSSSSSSVALPFGAGLPMPGAGRAEQPPPVGDEEPTAATSSVGGKGQGERSCSNTTSSSSSATVDIPWRIGAGGTALGPNERADGGSGPTTARAGDGDDPFVTLNGDSLLPSASAPPSAQRQRRGKIVATAPSSTARSLIDEQPPHLRDSSIVQSSGTALPGSPSRGFLVPQNGSGSGRGSAHSVQRPGSTSHESVPQCTSALGLRSDGQSGVQGARGVGTGVGTGHRETESAMMAVHTVSHFGGPPATNGGYAGSTADADAWPVSSSSSSKLLHMIHPAQITSGAAPSAAHNLQHRVSRSHTYQMSAGSTPKRQRQQQQQQQQQPPVRYRTFPGQHDAPSAANGRAPASHAVREWHRLRSGQLSPSGAGNVTASGVSSSSSFADASMAQQSPPQPQPQQQQQQQQLQQHQGDVARWRTHFGQDTTRPRRETSGVPGGMVFATHSTETVPASGTPNGLGSSVVADFSRVFESNEALGAFQANGSGRQPLRASASVAVDFSSVVRPAPEQHQHHHSPAQTTASAVSFNRTGRPSSRDRRTRDGRQRPQSPRTRKVILTSAADAEVASSLNATGRPRRPSSRGGGGVERTRSKSRSSGGRPRSRSRSRSRSRNRTSPPPAAAGPQSSSAEMTRPQSRSRNRSSGGKASHVPVGVSPRVSRAAAKAAQQSASAAVAALYH